MNKDILEALLMEPHKLGILMGFDKLQPIHSEWIRYCWHPTEARALQAYRGSYKCFGRGTLVMMADYSAKPVQDIKVGDYVMGWNFTPRKVLETHSGFGKMYEISGSSNEDTYYCNGEHILVLYKNDKTPLPDYDKYKKKNSLSNYMGLDYVYEIPVKDLSFMDLSYFRQIRKGNFIGVGVGIKQAGDNTFYGFQIEGDGVFLLKNHILVHNSSSVVVVGTIWWLLMHPNDTICIIRKKSTLAQQVTEQIIKAMAMPVILDVFEFAHGSRPKVTMQRAGSVAYDFLTKPTNVPSITPLGIDSNSTGLHFDRLVVDDFVVETDRWSRAERRKTKNAVVEFATNIINPGCGSVWTGTPWHPEDAWTIVNQFAKIIKYPLSKFNWFGDEYVEQKRKTTTPLLFACNYELDFTKDETLMFSRFPPKFAEWEKGCCYGHIDTAFDGDHYCALSFLQYVNDTPRVVGFVYEGNINDWTETVVELCRHYQCIELWVENNADKGAFHKVLDKYLPYVHGYTEYGNKHAKIGSYLYPIFTDILFAPETEKEYLDQIINYAEGVEPDDAPDSLASLCRAVTKAGIVREEDIPFFWTRPDRVL